MGIVGVDEVGVSRAKLSAFMYVRPPGFCCGWPDGLELSPGRIFVDHILLRTKNAGFWCVEFYLVGRFAVVGLCYTHPLPNENNFYT